MTLTEDDRITAVGLANYGEAYRDAAMKLLADPPQPFQAPAVFLYLQTLELYLKASLRQSGLTVEQLKGLGHNLPKLMTRCAANGLAFTQDDLDFVGTFGAHDDVMLSRYIKNVETTRVPLSAYAATVDRIIDAVREQFKTAGVFIVAARRP